MFGWAAITLGIGSHSSFIEYNLMSDVITFRVRHSRGEMNIGHGRLCLSVCICLSVPGRIPILLHGAGCNLG